MGYVFVVLFLIILGDADIDADEVVGSISYRANADEPSW
jgi:hypothetical protein